MPVTLILTQYQCDAENGRDGRRITVLTMAFCTTWRYAMHNSSQDLRVRSDELEAPGFLTLVPGIGSSLTTVSRAIP